MALPSSPDLSTRLSHFVQAELFGLISTVFGPTT